MLYGILYHRRKTDSRLRIICLDTKQFTHKDEDTFRRMGWTRCRAEFFDEKGPDAKFWLGDQSP